MNEDKEFVLSMYPEARCIIDPTARIQQNKPPELVIEAGGPYADTGILYLSRTNIFNEANAWASAKQEILWRLQYELER